MISSGQTRLSGSVCRTGPAAVSASRVPSGETAMLPPLASTSLPGTGLPRIQLSELASSP
jgi:hypothetical protein